MIGSPIIFAALPLERFELLVDSVSEDVPLLFNLETQQRIYLSEYLHEFTRAQVIHALVERRTTRLSFEDSAGSQNSVFHPMEA